MQTLGNSRCFSFLYNEKQLDECNYRSESNGEATIYDFESGLKETCENIFTDVENEKSFKGSDKLKITLSEKRTSVIYEYKIEG